MNKIVLVLLFFSYFNSVGCRLNPKEIESETSSGSKILEYRNDTIIQRVELFIIHIDTMKVNIKTSNLSRKTSCSIEGIAFRDTVGNFLNGEETVQDENGDVFSVDNYRFLYKDTLYLLGIELERRSKNRLVYYQVESAHLFDNPFCLLYSVGTLREKVSTQLPQDYVE